MCLTTLSRKKGYLYHHQPGYVATNGYMEHCLATFATHSTQRIAVGRPLAIAASSRHDVVVTSTADNTLVFHRLSDGAHLTTQTGAGAGSVATPFQFHLGGLCVSTSGDEVYVADCGNSRVVRVALDTQTFIASLGVGTGSVQGSLGNDDNDNGGAVSPDHLDTPDMGPDLVSCSGTLLAVAVNADNWGSNPRDVWLLSPLTGQVHRRIQSSGLTFHLVKTLALTNNGTLLTVFDADRKRVRRIQTTNPRTVWTQSIDTFELTDIAACAACGDDGSLLLIGTLVTLDTPRLFVTDTRGTSWHRIESAEASAASVGRKIVGAATTRAGDVVLAYTDEGVVVERAAPEAAVEHFHAALRPRYVTTAAMELPVASPVHAASIIAIEVAARSQPTVSVAAVDPWDSMLLCALPRRRLLLYKVIDGTTTPTLTLTSVDTGAIVYTLRAVPGVGTTAFPSLLHSVCPTPNEAGLLVCDTREGRIRQIHIGTGSTVRFLGVGIPWAPIVVDCNDHVVVVGTVTGDVHALDYHTGAHLWHVPFRDLVGGQPASLCVKALRGSSGTVLAFNTYDASAATITPEGGLQSVIQGADSSPVKPVTTTTFRYPMCATECPGDGRVLFADRVNGTLAVLDLATGTVARLSLPEPIPRVPAEEDDDEVTHQYDILGDPYSDLGLMYQLCAVLGNGDLLVIRHRVAYVFAAGQFAQASSWLSMCAKVSQALGTSSWRPIQPGAPSEEEPPSRKASPPRRYRSGAGLLL